MDLDVLKQSPHAMHQQQMMSFVIDSFNHGNVKEIYSIIVAQATIDGSLYNGNTPSAQPRIGLDQCISCVPGTWPDPDGQR
jgi:hypothetical protein